MSAFDPLAAAGDAIRAHFEAQAARIAELEGALERQCDNMAFALNHFDVPSTWFGKFDRELSEDRTALRGGTQP